MHARSRRRDMFEVAEHAPAHEPVEGLCLQRAFAIVGDVVDRKARHHRVEAAEVRQRLGEVVSHELDATLVCEPLACGLEHRLGDVETHAGAVWSVRSQQGEQASIPRAKIEDSAGVARHVLEQDALTLGAVRQRVRTGEVAQRMLWVPPLARRTVGHPGDYGRRVASLTTDETAAPAGR